MDNDTSAAAATASAPAPPADKGTDPSTFLSDIIGSPVTVKLNSGVVYKGTILYYTIYSLCLFCLPAC